jgi:hypothetical protein
LITSNEWGVKIVKSDSKVRETGRNVVDEGAVRAEAGLDPDPGGGERIGLVSLPEKIEDDLVPGPESFGLGTPIFFRSSAWSASNQTSGR